jgi:hypothetical protein
VVLRGGNIGGAVGSYRYDVYRNGSASVTKLLTP